jgi:NitT/TauT family transport system permease protein
MTSHETDLGVTVPLGEKSGPTRPRHVKRRGPVFWRVRDDIPRSLELPLIGLSLVLPLALWSAVYYSGTVSPFALPSPVATAQASYDMLTGGILLPDAWDSVRRVAIGFGLSLLVSVPLGLAMGTFRSVRALFEPGISLIRYAPATAFTLLVIIWFGIGEQPKIALVFIGTVFFNTLMTANVVWQVPSELIRVSQTLGAGSYTVFRKVIFPYAVPGIIDTARINLAAASSWWPSSSPPTPAWACASCGRRSSSTRTRSS